MAELLTTDEAAAHLRMSERKLYELVAAGAVPCSKATGRWLFPKQALDRWVMAGLIAGQQFAQATPPPTIGGGVACANCCPAISPAITQRSSACLGKSQRPVALLQGTAPAATNS